MKVPNDEKHAVGRSGLSAGLGADFLTVDEALYRLESPFYRACVTGTRFDKTAEWERERKLLTTLWYKLCPYRAKADPKKTWMDRLKAWLSSNVKVRGCALAQSQRSEAERT